MKTLIAVFVFATMSFAFAHPLLSHCEMPCGIYDDQMRINMIRERITTIEKAMQSIISLSKESPVNYNQLVRWTVTKEEHANQLQEIVQQYFMTQRIKPAHDENGAPSKSYVDQLTLLHEMLIHAMKAKQTTDLEEVKTLGSLTDKFSQLYFEGKK